MDELAKNIDLILRCFIFALFVLTVEVWGIKHEMSQFNKNMSEIKRREIEKCLEDVLSKIQNKKEAR